MLTTAAELEPLNVWQEQTAGTLGAQGIDCTPWAPAVTVQLAPPLHSWMEVPLAEPVRRALLKDSMSCPAYFGLAMDDTSVLGNNIFIKGNRFFHDKLSNEKRAWSWQPGRNDLREVSPGRFQSVRATRVTKRLPGVSVVVNSTSGANNYHHWLNDCIPLLEGARRTAGTIDHFIVSQFISDSFLRIGTLYGLDPNRIQSFNPRDDGVIQLERVILPSPLNVLNEWVRPEHVAFLRTAIGPARARSTAGSAKRIYLSRLDALHGVRALLNEQALAAELEKEGFSIIRMSDHPFEDQVAIINAAEVVVGLHGAAMANLVFAAPQARVMLIEHELKGYVFYRQICQLIGCSYSTVVGDTFLNPGHTSPGQNQDWIVDIGAVLKIARRL